MWTYFLSVYFIKNKNEKNLLDDQNLYDFLDKITAFIWAYAITNPGVNALRSPVFNEMINIVQNKEVRFEEYKFDSESTKIAIENYGFWNQRPVTKSMLTWWAFRVCDQRLIDISNVFEIEHIFAKNRYENDSYLK